MKIVIEGNAFDTANAKKHYVLSYWDGHNWIEGDLFLSSKDNWYMHTPSQWHNQREWILTSPIDVIEQYRKFLQDEEINEISTYISDWE